MIFLFVFVSLSLAQSIDSLLTAPAINCWDVWYNAGKQLVRLHGESKRDSIIKVLEFWEKHCGDNEGIRRYRVIDRISNKSSTTDLIDSSVVYYLLNFRHRRMAILANPKNEISINRSYNYPIPPEFDSLTIKLSDSLLHSKTEDDIDVQLFLLAYSQKFDDFFTLLYSNSSSMLSSKFKKEFKQYDKLGEWNLGLQSGVWIPFGDMATVGNHPAFGFFVGYKKRKILFDWTLYFKFIESKNDYTVFEEGRSFTTRHFFGGYIGFDAAYFLLEKTKIKMPLRLGIAYDGWDALKKDVENDIPSKSLPGLNINLGVEPQLYLNKYLYCSLELKAAYIAIDNTKGTDVSGPALTALIKFGFLGNGQKDNAKEYFGIR